MTAIAVVAMAGATSLRRGKTEVRDNAGLCVDKHCERGPSPLRLKLDTTTVEELKVREDSDAVECEGNVKRPKADAVWKLQKGDVVWWKLN